MDDILRDQARRFGQDLPAFDLLFREAEVEDLQAMLDDIGCRQTTLHKVIAAKAIHRLTQEIVDDMGQEGEWPELPGDLRHLAPEHLKMLRSQLAHALVLPALTGEVADAADAGSFLDQRRQLVAIAASRQWLTAQPHYLPSDWFKSSASPHFVIQDVRLPAVRTLVFHDRVPIADHPADASGFVAAIFLGDDDLRVLPVAQLCVGTPGQPGGPRMRLDVIPASLTAPAAGAYLRRALELVTSGRWARRSDSGDGLTGYRPDLTRPLDSAG